MDSINNIMNLIFPPLALYGLFVFFPTYQRWKSVISIFRNLFAEDVSGKVVLITGAASGIGESLAYEYGRSGAYLALVDIRGDPLYNVAALAEIYGSPEVIPILGDVSKVEDCEHFINVTVVHFGRLDHLVTNAGVAPLYLFEDIDDLSKARPAMDINFWGSVYCAFFACAHLKKSKGRIVVIASGCGYLPAPRLSFYCVQISLLPVESAETCARAIMKSVCRGERYVMEPAWIGSVILWKVFCPELMEWLSRWLVSADTAVPPTEAPSKKILDLARAIKGFCLSTAQFIKTVFTSL